MVVGDRETLRRREDEEVVSISKGKVENNE